ncbi:hypothetical protein OUZ56_027144 [Daphnia magna]|uniref:GMPS ATP-PPase domain-containing protein n=1 Tax=Daphnia magna TaxID=35525 RepID=A0ABQ9ZP07_9CRUS|nr:hypothetical protein OUZ56_027144 [Daphnia magna]
MLVRGGVDSAVCAALLHKALLQGDDSSRVQAIHIDNGFLRKDESEQVVNSLQQLGFNLRVVEASLTFYDASTNVHVADRTANDLNLTWYNLFLGQGTLMPDLIESASHMASSLADAVKTHHNDSEMVRQLHLSGRIVELLKGDCRTYSYCVALSSDQTQPNWNDLATYARLITRLCHNFNRVCYVFGKAVRESVTDVTPTFLTSNILATSRKADYLANKIFRDSFSPRGWRQDG